MRLQDFEINSIKLIATHIFGNDSKVFLFGSRIYDDIKGGDIDLYIQASDNNLWGKNWFFSATKISDWRPENWCGYFLRQIDTYRTRSVQKRNRTIIKDIEKTFKEKLYECDKHVEKITVPKNYSHTAFCRKLPQFTWCRYKLYWSTDFSISKASRCNGRENISFHFVSFKKRGKEKDIYRYP